LSVLLSRNLHPHLQLYKISDLRPSVFSSIQVDQMQVAFVSSCFENPLSRTSYFFDGFQLKTQNMPFRSIIVDVTCQKRGRVLHHGFQTPRNRWYACRIINALYVFEDNSNSPEYWIYTLIIATYCINKRGLDCALLRALSFRRFSSFPSSILLSFTSYYLGSLHTFFSFFSCAASGLEPLSFPIPLVYESLFYTTTLQSSVEIYPFKTHFYFTWLVRISKNLHYNMQHENMHRICGANTPRQVQLHMYTRCRYIEGESVFGGIWSETKACFFIVVGQRDKDTLLIVIHAHMLPGTNAMSDMWRALKRLPKSEPQPELRKPNHRCAHLAHSIYKNGCGSSTMEMIHLDTLSSISPTCMKYAKMRKLFIVLLYALLVICRHFMAGRNKIHRSFIAWDWIWGKRRRDAIEGAGLKRRSRVILLSIPKPLLILILSPKIVSV